MSKLKILLQLDPDDQPSVFDAVTALDAGVDHLLRHARVHVEEVRDLVHGAMFTRGPDDLRQTAIFLGGSDVQAGEALLKQVKKAFFGPLRVSVMIDSNGANTTAAAAVLAAEKHVTLQDAEAVVLGATGPVGQRVVRLLAGQGAKVRVASRSKDRAAALCQRISEQLSDARLTTLVSDSPKHLADHLSGVQVLIAAGAAGVQLVSQKVRASCSDLQVAVDLNAVPPLGLEGVEVTDSGATRDGTICYGAIGVGGTKMKIHKAAIQQLFQGNDQILDAEEIFQLGRTL
jgi:hypothetical protein